MSIIVTTIHFVSLILTTSIKWPLSTIIIAINIFHHHCLHIRPKAAFSCDKMKKFVHCCPTVAAFPQVLFRRLWTFPSLYVKDHLTWVIIEQKASCLGMNWYCYFCYLGIPPISILILTSVTNTIDNLHPRGGLIARSTLGEVQADTRSLCLKEPVHHDDHINPCLDDLFALKNQMMIKIPILMVIIMIVVQLDSPRPIDHKSC